MPPAIYQAQLKVHLPPVLKRRIFQRAKKHGVKVGQFAREALTEKLAREK